MSGKIIPNLGIIFEAKTFRQLVGDFLPAYGKVRPSWPNFYSHQSRQLPDKLFGSRGSEKKDCKASFAAAIEKQIKAKEKEYESLLDNMGQSVLSPDILDDITARMKTLKEEIKTLKNTTPPEEASTELIVNWLRAIREAPDSRAVHLLIEKVEIFADKEKTDFHIVSTLESVSENLVRVEITDSAANGHVAKKQP